MITPEKAHDLLAGDFGSEVLVDFLGNSRAGFSSVAGAFIVTTPGDFDLTEYAPDMAETIAKMTWEYAAVVEIRPGVWRYLSHGETVTQLSHKAKWFTTPGDAGRYAKDRGWPEHTVRRLVSDTEVIK